MMGFAVVVPIGPGSAELRRFHDFLDSLWSYERGMRLCVAIDDSKCPRNVVPRGTRACRFVTMRDPFRGQGEPLMGRLSASLLVAYDYIRRAGVFDFILRADTDALVTGRFRHAVSTFLSRHPQTGMLGTLGFTCRRSHSHYGIEKRSISDVVVALETLSPECPAFLRINDYLQAARHHGYAGKEYCQGGIYALPFRTLERMAIERCFDHPADWLPLAVPEDVMMGMLTRAVGLESSDYSRFGEPFGNHCIGLPYAPREMLHRGHALIHSLKGDPDYAERTLRRFFRSHRHSGRKYATKAFSVSASV